MVIQGDKGESATPHPVDSVGADEVRAELGRVQASKEFAGSTALHRFLGYCVEQSLGNRSEDLKEHSIAVHVFGRREDFDGRIDTIVRVQAHRLRTKLSSYYEGEGLENPVRISIPKGSYRPRFLRRSEGTRPLSSEPSPTAPQPVETAAAPSRPTKMGLAALFAGGIAVGLLAAWVAGQGRAPSQELAPAVQELWSPMLASKSSAAQIIYQPTVFVSNRSVLLRYEGPYDAPTDTPIAELNSPIGRFVDPRAFSTLGPFVFNYSWAPVGLAAETHHLTKMFTTAGRPVQLRTTVRSEPNDLLKQDVILLDSHSEADVFEHPVFTLETELTDGDDAAGTVEFARIKNHDPASGEPSLFEIEHSADTHARTVDYGLFSMKRNPDGESATALFSGITTFGDWGAVQYVTSEAGAAELLERLGSPLPRSLQAVIKVTIERDTVSSMELVAARALE